MKGLLQEDQYSHKQATRGHAKKLNSTQDKADQAQLKLSLSQKHHMGVWLKLLQENLKVKEKFKIKKKRSTVTISEFYTCCACAPLCARAPALCMPVSFLLESWRPARPGARLPLAPCSGIGSTCHTQAQTQTLMRVARAPTQYPISSLLSSNFTTFLEEAKVCRH